MAPKSPWNQKATINTNVQKPVNNEQKAPSGIKYGEVQAEEVEVLKAIYMDDYEQVEVKGAWSTSVDLSFKLKLRSFSDESTFMTLSVRLTATYPKTAPLLETHGLDNFHERTRKRITNITVYRPKSLIGEVMIHTIANEIQDALEDAVQARQQGTLPSLEDERANAEDLAATLAKQAEEAEAQKQQEAKDEEERVLQRMLDDEMDRRERRKPAKTSNEAGSSANANTSSETIIFDQSATMRVGSESFDFNEVLLLTSVSRKRDKQIFLAKPQLLGVGLAPLVAVKRIIVKKSRDEVLELESILTTIVKLRHAGLLSIFSYRIHKLSDATSELVLCTEHADRGTLQTLLNVGSLTLEKAKQFTIELLEALDYLHSTGMAHGSICLSNIAMVEHQSTSLKLFDFAYAYILEGKNDTSAKWPAPEAGNLSPAATRKRDIWDLGEVLSQMFLGVEVTSKYSSPLQMLSRIDVSDTFDDFLRKPFIVQPKKRPSAFDLLPSTFLRTDTVAINTFSSRVSRNGSEKQRANSGIGTSPAKPGSRHNSSSLLEPMSRYASDFTELGRLGKGGFGEVVKARNKLDGGVYAIKKIKQAPQLLDQVISEVMLLNRLNHPYVVRYFSTWIEDDTPEALLGDSSTETETATEAATDNDTSDGPRMDFGYQSRGGLDFVSSNGFPQIEFGEDSADEAPSEDEDEKADKVNDIAKNEMLNEANGTASTHANGTLHRLSSASSKARSTLYIQMEYCERHTLRDLVRKSMATDECWGYIRQITEGLSHIHAHGIIHRDLKPDNIFIDLSGSPKIGDFGLATTAQHHYVERPGLMSGNSAGDMTRSVGTTLYVAPELQSTSGTSYSDKVDMYSLGIIFYEMCEPFKTGMERINALQRIRMKDHELPSGYKANSEKAAQGNLISCLISHKPSERPSSTELLRGDMLPVKMEDETIRKALTGLSDSRSPYHQKMMSALFAHDSMNSARVKALAWDARSSTPTEDSNRLRLKGIARHHLQAIFRRHGAEETRRQSIFPRSGYYTNANLYQVLDASGNLLQLPYDLTLPHARQIARQSSEVRCTYSFGNAYRDAFDSGPPRVSEEVDFAITDSGHDGDRAFNDAEVIKVIDEMVSELPLFASHSSMSFHLNHAHILDVVLEFCRIPTTQWPTVKEMLSRLGFHQYTWSKMRAELRKFGLADTVLDDLEQFDFRELRDKAFLRLKSLLEKAGPRLRNKLSDGITSLSEVVRYLTQLNLKRPVYLTPLGSVNAKFYEEGTLFQCVLERKSNRVVIAAGGRYDSLIRVHRPVDVRVKPQGAVGVSIGLDPIITNMAKHSIGSSKKAYLKQQPGDGAIAKRCNVLIIAGGSAAVRATGIKLLSTFWENNIGAELGSEQSHASHEYDFVVTLKHETSNTVKFFNEETEDEDLDVPISTLVNRLQQDLRELNSSRIRISSLQRHASQPEGDRKGNVHVLMARYGSKKTNKYQIVSDAQEQWSRKLDEAKNAPILAVETKDEVLDLIQQTRLGDSESWRKAVQSVQVGDRQYVQQIQDMLSSWRRKWEEDVGMREACIFNFRTQRCIYYDLGL